MGRLFVISGSSGVGKGTLLKLFLEKHPEFKLSVFCTTRKPREGEENGVNYFFLSQAEFKELIERDEFLEWAEFSGNMYGTQKAYVERKLSEGKNLILELDTTGALNVKAKMPEACLIFISPPSFEELESRLRGRHTETEEAIQKRLNTVKIEIERSNQFDYKVINDNLERAIQELESIMEGSKCEWKVES